MTETHSPEHGGSIPSAGLHATRPGPGLASTPSGAPDTHLPPTFGRVLRLQRLAGNHAVGDMLGQLQRMPASPLILRQIGPGKSGWIVKHSTSDVRYVAYQADATNYDLQPLGPEPPLRVANDDPAYESVEKHQLGGLGSISDAPTRKRTAAGTAQWSAQAAARALQAGDFQLAFEMFERAEQALPHSVDAAVGLAKTEADLIAKLKTLSAYGDTWFNEFRKALLLPSGAMLAEFKKIIAVTPKRMSKYKIADIDKDAVQTGVAQQMETAILNFREGPEFPAYIDVIRTQVTQQKTAAYAQATPTLIQDPDFKQAYVKMTAVKHEQEARKASLPVYNEVLIADLAPSEADRPAFRQKSDLLHHLGKPITRESLSRSFEEILREAVTTKAERLRFLFDEFPTQMADAAAKVGNADINALLLDIKNGKPHSIKDINDYVGDKLNDPLMEWVINKHIPVEVHATSAVASFAKLKSDGYSDIIEIPSSHKGTKKYVASNPATAKAKVVFQTLVGESYAIQTTGAFLFYEIYEAEPSLPRTVPLSSTATKYVHPGYRARNLVEKNDTTKIATYLLIPDAGSETLFADIAYPDKPHAIGSDGAIELSGGITVAEIKLRKVKVKSLPLDQLTVLTENADHEKIYLDVFSTYGVATADIAAIGRKGELKKLLTELSVTATRDVVLPYFNMTVYEIKSSASTGKATLLTFGISPDFFGDKAGKLASALQKIGVKDITFVGTAGGLAPGLAKEDLVIAEQVQNAATGKLGGDEYPNRAATMLSELKGLPGVNASKVKSVPKHVGVHSPITESDDMIEWMKSTNIGSVDCEAGFIADALKGTGVNLYQIFFISDLPGTQESIGLGGIAADTTATTPLTGATTPTTATAVEPTEQMVQHIVEGIVKRKIEAADRTARNNAYPITADGKISKIKLPGLGSGLVNGHIQLQVMLPTIAKETNIINVLKLLAEKISKVAESSAGVIAITEQNTILDLARDFYSTHRIQVIAKFAQGS